MSREQIVSSYATILNVKFGDQKMSRIGQFFGSSRFPVKQILLYNKRYRTNFESKTDFIFYAVAFIGITKISFTVFIYILILK
jgi:hypothetical protein